MSSLSLAEASTVVVFGLDAFDEVEHLRAVAKAACTPNGPSVWWGETDLRERLDHPDAVVDAPFIAACNPGVILQLLADLDRLQMALTEAQAR